VKSDEEIMEILEAYDLTGSYRDAGELAGCSHHTVADHVEARAAGSLGEAARRDQLIDPFLAKLEEWVEASKGKVRADVAHDKLVALGYPGSERTTRRAVAAARKAYVAGRRRIYRPWVPEPGMWFLCGIPHRNHYEEGGTMRRPGPVDNYSRCSGWVRPNERLHIITAPPRRRGAGQAGGICLVGYLAERFGRALVL
jgi:hypothetical protein